MAGRFPRNTGKIRNINPDTSWVNTGNANYTGTVKLSTSFDIVDKDGFLIGYIKQLNPNKSRTTERIRHLGFADAGAVLEQAPKPEDLTLNITGFALYNDQEDGSIVQRLGGTNTMKAMASLEEQKEGFDIIAITKNPKTKQTVDVKVYQDCWLQSHAEPISIDTATIAETASIIASRTFRPNDYATY